MTENAKTAYANLSRYADIRSNELAALLAPYIDITNRYGEVLCGIIVILGKVPPAGPRDAAARDLIADVFDFLYEARALIIKSKLEVAYPLARRAYESYHCLLRASSSRSWPTGGSPENKSAIQKSGAFSPPIRWARKKRKPATSTTSSARPRIPTAPT